jgi:8-oxo-dGTP diphosphatase/2-hydroxy-dATP diphosphatase
MTRKYNKEVKNIKIKKLKKITTLCIIHQQSKILLGMKKRGFGVGRWNGFGGKVGEGETIEQAAKRELLEEANISVENIRQLGKIDFYWKAGSDIIEVNIFKAENFNGIPSESEEMRPEWFDIREIPFDKMWQDDKYWLPLFLDNKKFLGKFMFDGNDNILEKELNEVESI